MTAEETQPLVIADKKIFPPAQSDVQPSETKEPLSEDMKALARALAVHSAWSLVGLLEKRKSL